VSDLLVHLRQVDPAGPQLHFNLIDLDQEAGGVARWNTFDRNFQKDGIIWVGQSLSLYTLPLRLDGYSSDPVRSVEADIRTLQSFGRMVAGSTPPRLGLTGNVSTPASMRWVITGLEWGQAIRDENGQRLQQDVVVELTEFVQLTPQGWAEAAANLMG